MRLVAAACAAALSACAHSRAPAPFPREAEPAAESLFASDAAVLPDEAIARILAHGWSSPAPARLAVLRVGQRSPFLRWSDEFARLEGELREGLMGTLRAHGGIAAVSELPSLLVPREQTVGHLREAAARYRADLLLAWRADCRSYERFRLFSRDVAKAHCDVESVLLDVRTGIVPWASAVSRDYATAQGRDELSAAESARRAEVQATGDALQEVARGLLAFLGGSAPPAR
jgi:hypothetical protein